MQAASNSFRAYALDLWGFGDSAKASEKYLLSEQTKLLDDFLNEMGIGKIAVVGHGLGAVVGLMFAEHYPQYVDRVMAIGLPFETSLINPRLREASPIELADWLLGEKHESQTARMEAPKADQHAIVRTLQNLESLQITNLVAQINTPSLLVYGQNDPAISMINNHRLFSLPDHIKWAESRTLKNRQNHAILNKFEQSSVAQIQMGIMKKYHCDTDSCLNES